MTKKKTDTQKPVKKTAKKTVKKDAAIQIEIRTAIVVVKLDNGTEFHVRPENYADINNTYKWAAENDIPEMNRSVVQSFLFNCYSFMLRIEKWKGIVMNGKPAESNMENITTLFAQQPDLLTAVMEKYGKVVTTTSKNLNAS